MRNRKRVTGGEGREEDVGKSWKEKREGNYNHNILYEDGIYKK